jgi:hypothetical protein
VLVYLHIAWRAPVSLAVLQAMSYNAKNSLHVQGIKYVPRNSSFTQRLRGDCAEIFYLSLCDFACSWGMNVFTFCTKASPPTITKGAQKCWRFPYPLFMLSIS